MRLEAITRLQGLRSSLLSNTSKLTFFHAIFYGEHNFLYGYNRSVWSKQPDVGLAVEYVDSLSIDALAEVLAHEFVPKESLVAAGIDFPLDVGSVRIVHTKTYQDFQAPIFWQGENNIVKEETNSFTKRLKETTGSPRCSIENEISDQNAVKIRGRNIVNLIRDINTKDVTVPQIVSAKVSPNGADLISLKVLFPGKTEPVEVLVTRSPEELAKLLKAPPENPNNRFDKNIEGLGGPVIGPVPNRATGRIIDGKVEIIFPDGQIALVPLNQPDTDPSCLLHGSFSQLAQQIVDARMGPNNEPLVKTIVDVKGNSESWPWPADSRIETTTSIVNNKLKLQVVQTNTDDKTTWASWTYHPYFKHIDNSRRTVRLKIPAKACTPLEKGPDGKPDFGKCLPDGRIVPLTDPEVAEYNFNLPAGKALGDLFLDDNFTDLIKQADGSIIIEVLYPESGYKLRIRAYDKVITRTGEVRQGNLKSAQVYSPSGSDFICIEPSANLNDPFNKERWKDTDTGMVKLEKGDQYIYEYEIEYLPLDKNELPKTVTVVDEAKARGITIPEVTSDLIKREAGILGPDAAGKNVLFWPDVDFVQGKPLDHSLIKTTMTAADVIALLKKAKQNGTELSIVGHLRGVDGPGSSLDLPEFQLALTPEGTLSMEQLPSTPTIASEFTVKIKFELADDENAIEYVAPDYGITAGNPMRIVGPVKLDTRGKTAQKNAPAFILRNIFGLQGVRVTCEEISPMARAGGMESSNVFNVALISAGSMLSGANLSLADIFNLAVKLENDEFGGLTGGQGHLCSMLGGAYRNTWLSGMKGSSANIVNPYSAYSEPLLTEKELAFVEDHFMLVQAGKEYKNGKEQIGRTAALINWMWTDLLRDKDEIGMKLHREKLGLAARYTHALKVGDAKTMVETINRYVDIRNELCLRWTNLMLDAKEGKPVPSYAHKYSDKVFDESNSDYQVLRDMYKTHGEDLRKMSLYTLNPISDLVDAARKEGIAIMPLGAGGPGANLIAVSAKGSEHIKEFLQKEGLSELTTAEARNIIRDTGTLKGFMPFKAGRDPMRFNGFEKLGLQKPAINAIETLKQTQESESLSIEAVIGEIKSAAPVIVEPVLNKTEQSNVAVVLQNSLIDRSCLGSEEARDKYQVMLQDLRHKYGDNAIVSTKSDDETVIAAEINRQMEKGRTVIAITESGLTTKLSGKIIGGKNRFKVVGIDLAKPNELKDAMQYININYIVLMELAALQENEQLFEYAYRIVTGKEPPSGIMKAEFIWLLPRIVKFSDEEAAKARDIDRLFKQSA